MKLTDPFDVVHKKDIKNKQGVVVAQVDYVGWSQVADRLDAASPGWSFNVVQMGEDWCLGRLTLGDNRVFENVGYAENADADWKKEALKDAVSDSLKRCAALAGVARYLYDKDSRPNTAPRPAERPRTAPAPVSAPPTNDEPPWPEVDAIAAAKSVFGDDFLDESKCPDHDKPFKSGAKGWYCATPVEKNGDVVVKWCPRKPSKAWQAAQELVPA
jgi:hypothetical protein